MLCPQRRLDDAGCDRRDADPESRVELCQGAHEAVDRVLGGDVDGCDQRWALPRDAGDVDDVFA